MQRKITRRSGNTDIVWPEDIHPVLRKIYSSRVIHSADELDYSLGRLCPYDSLSNIDEATALLADRIEAQKYILIVSDYDADGATACALGIRGMNSMGVSKVEYLVPDRFKHGYGLSPAVIELALDLNPDVIITVDNGISSIDGVALARANGIDVIITDHHLPGKVLPDASAIVNPNLAGDKFPSKSIAGVGVMFYLLAALRVELRNRGWFSKQGIAEPNLATFLDLVALGTVADVVALDYNNRIMVSHGLELIRRGRCIPGIRALLEVAGKNHKNLVASDLGFVVGPRLNAAGRLTDMTLGIECLISNDDDKCHELAIQLDGLNQERKGIQDEMHQQAMQSLTRLELTEAQGQIHGLCLFNADWHQGVVGILASKIKDKVQRPVIAFARDEDGSLKGSARSVSGIHIRDVIDRIATQQPELIVTFGGHAMAAGLTILENAYEQFAEAFDEQISLHVKSNGLNTQMYSDGELGRDDICMEVAELIRAAGPWGQGFPEPVFEGMFEIIDKKIVGENHLKLKVKTPDNSQHIDAIAFNMTHRAWPKGTTLINAIYKLDINEYMGRRTTQLIVEYLEPLQGESL
jgi:single-stranded-DNA-specific exonuclease